MEIARVGRKPGVPAPILFLAGVTPYTGPWGYHPGRGRGGSPICANLTSLMQYIKEIDARS